MSLHWAFFGLSNSEMKGDPNYCSSDFKDKQIACCHPNHRTLSSDTDAHTTTERTVDLPHCQKKNKALTSKGRNTLSTGLTALLMPPFTPNVFLLFTWLFPIDSMKRGTKKEKILGEIQKSLSKGNWASICHLHCHSFFCLPSLHFCLVSWFNSMDAESESH